VIGAVAGQASKAMAEGVQSTRPGADEIYDRVRDDAAQELDRGPRALGLSALFAGFTMGATAIAYAAAAVAVHGSAREVVAALVYPVGYVGAIVGRAQLFTENTLYPVMLALGDRRTYLRPTARLWAIVMLGNLLGALLFALVVAESPALPGPVAAKIGALGDEAVARSFATTFWAAVLAGWVLALVAWLVEAADAAIGIVVVVWSLTLVVGLAHLDHSIATAIPAWSAVFRGDAGLGAAIGWQATTTLGNAVGGVFIVALLNYGQVRSQKDR
jgi:formate/nitrite transporter FocA (FNT family)